MSQKRSGKKLFPFWGLCKCGSFGEWITAEEKYKWYKYGRFKKYIYYSHLNITGCFTEKC
jgi:hypothetical protein